MRTGGGPPAVFSMTEACCVLLMVEEEVEAVPVEVESEPVAPPVAACVRVGPAGQRRIGI